MWNHYTTITLCQYHDDPVMDVCSNSDDDIDNRILDSYIKTGK